MLVTMYKSKIHRATVTEANLDYVGSITIDEELMEASGLYPGEKVAVVNINNGERVETYTLVGERGSGIIGINGAAARQFLPNDLVIIIAYGIMETEEAKDFKPQVVFVDESNRMVAREQVEIHAQRR
ncbi:MAG: hypothetical protein AVO33_05765 [delta proteobacterium ML8_F1]|nr:MAG: hypothetical protein AVO33_05765 [delta proteobacterium ML8_F1]